MSTYEDIMGEETSNLDSQSLPQCRAKEQSKEQSEKIQ